MLTKVLDYNLLTTPERISQVKSNSPSLANLSSAQLDTCATYILQFTDQPTKITPTPAEPLEVANQLPLDYTPPSYTHPRIPLDWTSPELVARHAAICQLKQAAATSTCATTAWKLRRLALDLTIEGGWIVAREPKPYAPSTLIQPIDLYQHLDLTNPFHIKHILKLYSQLKQSGHSWEFMEEFDGICTKANLLPWQEHLVCRMVDGAQTITIGLELAQLYNKAMSPSYLSQAKRAIYTKIAKAAKLAQLEYTWAHDPTKWKVCPQCGQKKLWDEQNYYTKPNSSRKMCRECAGKKRKQEGK